MSEKQPWPARCKHLSKLGTDEPVATVSLIGDARSLMMGSIKLEAKTELCSFCAGAVVMSVFKVVHGKP